MYTFSCQQANKEYKTGVTHAEKQELKTRRACFGTSDGTLTGIFIDWAALYQLPRSDAQTIAFKRALKNINCWYASIETHVRKFVSSPSALLRKNLRSVGKTMVLMTRTFSGTTLRHMLRSNNMLKMLLPECRQCEQDVAKEFIHLNQVLGQNLNQLVWQWIDRSQGYFQRFRRSGFDLAVGTVYSRRLCKKSSISDRMAPMTSASAVNWSSYGWANIQLYKIYTWVCSVRPDLLVCLHEGIVWNCD